mgnify:CR=1 FL=1
MTDIDNDQTLFVGPSASWSDTTFTTRLLSGLPAGYYRVTAAGRQQLARETQSYQRVTQAIALILSTLYVTLRDVSQIWGVMARALPSLPSASAAVSRRKAPSLFQRAARAV